MEPESTFILKLIVKLLLYSSSLLITRVRLILSIVERQTNVTIEDVFVMTVIKKSQIFVPLLLTSVACKSYLYMNLII